MTVLLHIQFEIKPDHLGFPDQGTFGSTLDVKVFLPNFSRYRIVKQPRFQTMGRKTFDFKPWELPSLAHSVVMILFLQLLWFVQPSDKEQVRLPHIIDLNHPDEKNIPKPSYSLHLHPPTRNDSHWPRQVPARSGPSATRDKELLTRVFRRFRNGLYLESNFLQEQFPIQETMEIIRGGI
jgi:hypothetical protein